MGDTRDSGAINKTTMISKTALIGVTGAALVGVAAATTSASPPFVTTALEVVSRASSSSEVLSLNLTNLIILYVLKVAIILIGLTFGSGATARSAGGGDITMDQVDLTGGMCFLLYTGGAEEKLNCVARSACESPVSADKFVEAGKMWYKMHSIIKAVPFTQKYRTIMDKVNEASEHGKTGKDCSIYKW